ncbi:phosphoethanolamine transferase [Fusobacterium sp. PH5-44]|uniref:phosphoethanolamine transferase n=1 Tax=unclassified Fusobacterium TaxID=2648384 RepID=UPI003D1AD576
MKSAFTKIYSKIQTLLMNQLFLILIISAFSSIPYGIERYILGKYHAASIISKSSRFLVSYLEFFIFNFIIFLFISYLSEKLSKLASYFYFAISLLVFIIEIFLLKNFSAVINPSAIQILLETNLLETKEFLMTYIDLKSMIFFLVIAITGILTYKKINKKYLSSKIYKNKYLIIVLFIVSLIKIFSLPRNIKNFNVSRLYLSMKQGFIELDEYKNIESSIINKKVEILENNSSIKNIILIIGESTSRNHMGIYGYTLNTTPLLNELEKNGNLYKYTNVISPHAHTIPSIKKMLTFYNFESDKPWYNYNNIIDVMKKAGYNTYWLSNQEFSGKYINIATAIGKKSHTTFFNSIANSDDDDRIISFDEEMVDKSINYINTEKNFVIYHLMGTHSLYKYRYPKSFGRFTNSHKKVIGEYDNAVLYNDYVINKIISNFSNQESIVIYVSDHGEEVYDFRDFIGHAEDKGSRYMIEVPFIIYVSDEFKLKYTEIVSQIQQSMNNPYMTDDLIHTILDISSIKTKEFDAKRSIINKDFDNARKRIFAEKDYDKYWKTK